MNGSILLAGASLLAVLLWWGSRRRPQALLASTDTQAVAALNRAQIEWVQQQAGGAAGAGARGATLPLPGDARQRRALVLHLQAQLAAEQPQRLAAMQQACAWGDRLTLPLLQRGMRDVDPAVRLQAARGMERFRGRTTVAATGPSSRPQPLPRNVARTR
jgi:hypothetical protein